MFAGFLWQVLGSYFPYVPCVVPLIPFRGVTRVRYAPCGRCVRHVSRVRGDVARVPWYTLLPLKGLTCCMIPPSKGTCGMDVGCVVLFVFALAVLSVLEGW